MERSRQESGKLTEMTITALFIAITYIATRFVSITLPIPAAGGLVHLGNVPVYIAAILFGKRAGAFAGAFGMALSDLTSGWTIWAPFTFIILWIEGYIVGSVTHKKKDLLSVIVAMLSALIIKCAGYYLAEVILYQNFVTPLYSVIANVTQVCVAAMITVIVIPSIRKVRNVLSLG